MVTHLARWDRSLFDLLRMFNGFARLEVNLVHFSSSLNMLLISHWEYAVVMGGQICRESLHVSISQGNVNHWYRGQKILELGSYRRIQVGLHLIMHATPHILTLEFLFLDEIKCCRPVSDMVVLCGYLS